ncbi:hypothetical protein NDU88_000831 [Pleurodeles waltl]|uniref:Uncharacterized protein n=1 Tax=Pleurodeles waltl TaxID=8319 RepID=A0AAV7S743_PLEWA|nr:hypothetical protein NDU88_000831 [Pleurodeles waltl]
MRPVLAEIAVITGEQRLPPEQQIISMVVEKGAKCGAKGAVAFLKPPFDTIKKQNIRTSWTTWIETFKDLIDALEEADNKKIFKYLKNFAGDGVKEVLKKVLQADGISYRQIKKP